MRLQAISAAIAISLLFSASSSIASNQDVRTDIPVLLTVHKAVKADSGSDSNPASNSASGPASSSAPNSAPGSASTPVSASVNGNADQSEAKKNKVVSGSVAEWQEDHLDSVVNQLIDNHFQTNADAKKLEHQVKHYRQVVQVMLANSKDSLNYSLPYQGVGPSKRMGKLVLSDEIKVRDAATAEYSKQVYVDKIHAQIIACLMQLATAIGSDDPDEQKELTASAMRQLETFVGSDQAEGARCLLVKMSEQTRNMVVDAKTSKWAALERQKKIDTIVDAAMAADPVVVELKKRVGKYAHPGVFKSKFSGVIESTLSGATWLTPGFAIPLGCEAALNAYIMATGGSEEGKIERTLLYNKRLESRKRLYESEASLAIDSYSFGSLTKNTTLTAFAKAVVVELSSKDAANRILQNNYSIHDADVVPKMKTSKKVFDEA